MQRDRAVSHDKFIKKIAKASPQSDAVTEHSEIERLVLKYILGQINVKPPFIYLIL